MSSFNISTGPGQFEWYFKNTGRIHKRLFKHLSFQYLLLNDYILDLQGRAACLCSVALLNSEKKVDPLKKCNRNSKVYKYCYNNPTYFIGS